MSTTPLYDALVSFAAQKPRRFHMPGHHGKALNAPEFAALAAIDFTELPPTGDLFEEGGPIEEAEQLWAKAYGMTACLFLTGGATQGNHAALTLAAKPGDTILLDRGSHRSVYNAMALLDLKPLYLTRPWLAGPDVTGPIDPENVDKTLTAHPEIKTVCITSPTYYGVLSDVGAISAIVHAHGGKLVVDGAHGAHLPFLSANPYGTADLLVVSAHKTLPAPGQTALLFSGGAYNLQGLQWAGSLYGSSSPSYPMMAALDLCRAFMEEEGAEAYRRTVSAVAGLRLVFPSITEEVAPLDPTRFVLSVPDGHGAKERLESRGVFPEMADMGHVVFILTAADGAEELLALAAGLTALDFSGSGAVSCPPPPALPEIARSPREGLFSESQPLPLEAAEGRVSAVQVAPYPPGVPVLAPGEVIEKKHLSYLTQIGYNMKNKIGVL